MLIVGLGSIAKKHINALTTLYPNIILYAFRSKKNANVVNGVLNIYSINELPDMPDIVIIATPTHLHALSIQQCLQLKRPMFLEKPLFHSVIAGEPIVQQLTEQNIITYTACNLRFHPAIIFLKNHLVGKRINEVNVYCGSYLPDWRAGRNFREIYSANADQGGGAHIDLIHEIDYIVWLLGNPQHILSVKRNVSSLSISAIDYATYLLEYPAFTASITLNYYRRDSKRTAEFVFEDDTWTVNLLSGVITGANGNTIFHAEQFNMADTYLAQMSYFIDCIKRNEQPMNSAREALDILNMTLNDGKS